MSPSATVAGVKHSISGGVSANVVAYQIRTLIGINMALQNKKSLGQNWLKDRAILNQIAEFAVDQSESALDAETTRVLEIGPGLGTLTSSLLRNFDEVIAVEFDEKLAHNLPGSFPGKNLKVINADFLQFDLNQVEAPYSVAGNIPYYITSPIIMKLINAENKPAMISLMIQKEVAERIAAHDGDHTVISLSVKNKAKVTLGPVVGRELFTPPPKVDSQVIVLEPLPKAQVSEDVIKLIKRGFSNPRKKLIKNLGQVSKADLQSIFTELNISENARPADLSLQTWAKLHEKLSNS